MASSPRRQRPRRGAAAAAVTIDCLHVSYHHPGAPSAAVDDVSLCLAPGWTGLTGANGSGKTTLLRLLAGDLEPAAGTVGRPPLTLRCPQDTVVAPPALDDLLRASSGRRARIRSRLAVEWDWGERWDTLSHGERKRAQVAVALAAAPDLLLLDEPTNHLDHAGRSLLIDALRAFRGVGLVVSHDRVLLDALCTTTVFMAGGRIEAIPGPYTDAAAERDRRAASARREQVEARKDVKRLEAERASRAEAAARARRLDSKRGIPARDHDAKSKIDAGRVSGRDAVAGRRLNQLSGRLQQVRDRAAALGVTRECGTRIVLPGERGRRDTVVAIGPARLRVGDAMLSLPELRVRPGERVALTGPNGAGKSTLIRHLVAVSLLPSTALLHLPQEVAPAAAAALLGRLADLAPADLGRALTVVASLGSDPTALLESGTPSPGELHKLLLGLGTLTPPELIVMDEPTNHLDLPSVEALEAALRDCPAAMVLVSHDERFLNATGCAIRWRLDGGGVQATTT